MGSRRDETMLDDLRNMQWRYALVPGVMLGQLLAILAMAILRRTTHELDQSAGQHPDLHG